MRGDLMKQRGQAAMEFLMTYGWAILVVLIAIGALAYFGVLNPSRFLPRSCTLMPGLDCDEFKVDNSVGQVQLYIRNGIGDSITFSTLGVDINADGDMVDAGTDCLTISAPLTIADGALSAQINIDCPAAAIGTVGDRFRGDILGGYTLAGSTLDHTMAGSIISEVEA